MKRWVPLFILFLLALVACGGGTADEGASPVETAQRLMQMVEDEEFDRISDLACEAQKEEVAQTFNMADAIAGSMGAADVDPQKILDAMTFTFANAEYEEVSKSGDEAVVRVQGRLEISVDEEKFKEIVKDLLKAEGLEDVPDSMIDQASEPILAQFEDFGQDMDERMRLVKEDGEWVICD